MNFQQVMQEVQRGNVHSVYVLSGTEYYFIEQIKEQLEKHTRAVENGEIILYDLLETPIQEVIVDAETFPFFSEKKLIIAHHPVFLQTKPDKTTIDHDLTSLEQFLQHPVTYTTLVFIAPYEKLDARKKITKLFKKTSVSVDCNPVKGKAFLPILEEMAANEHIHLTKEAALLLESEFQSNLYILQKELNKLAIYVGENRKVTKEIAEQMISPSNTFNALQFVDAVLKRDLQQAIRIFKELEKMNEEPIGLIALLAYQFRITFQVKLLKQKGYHLDRMKSELNVHPYVVQLALERSNIFSTERLALYINYLTQADENIKRGKMDKGIAFELLLYQLTNVSATK